MRDWHHNGWMPMGIDRGGNRRNYTIDAYGELETSDPVSLRMACYLLHGVHFGFQLPLAAREMKELWDYTGQQGDEYEPGSWGGHLVFSKAYNRDGMKVLTWGTEILVTNSFIKRYADEAWAVVDSLDAWRSKQTIDVVALIARLRQITSKVNV
jgi:hypothetical protein